MRPSFLPASLLSLLFTAATVSAQAIVDDLSFGHKDRIGTPDGKSIPNWHVTSSKHNIQILSDRAILTPPYPGNTRGALWSAKSIGSETWTAEVEFRAAGTDSGSGSNLNFWFAKDKNPILIDTLYTVSTFDGLVITIDQYGNTGGKVRGFLNDGTQDFKSFSDAQSARLAFGHCDYRYRNLGRPSKLKVIHQNGLTVSLDDKVCFSSSNIQLPRGYVFGITAAGGDQPDSFEVNKFIVSSTLTPPTNEQPPPKAAAPPPVRADQSPNRKFDRLPGAPELVPDKPASEITKQEDQFADLHNRLQTISHQVAMVFSEIEQLGEKVDARQAPPVADAAPPIPNAPPPGEPKVSEVYAKVDTLTRRLANIESALDSIRKGFDNVEKIVEHTRREIEGRNYHENFHQLNMALETVTASAPRMGLFVLMVLGTQVVIVGAYVVYKRRRQGMPKKFL